MQRAGTGNVKSPTAAHDAAGTPFRDGRPVRSQVGVLKGKVACIVVERAPVAPVRIFDSVEPPMFQRGHPNEERGCGISVHAPVLEPKCVLGGKHRGQEGRLGPRLAVAPLPGVTGEVEDRAPAVEPSRQPDVVQRSKLGGHYRRHCSYRRAVERRHDVRGVGELQEDSATSDHRGYNEFGRLPPTRAQDGMKEAPRAVNRAK